jgi:hypothetical protein
MKLVQRAFRKQTQIWYKEYLNKSEAVKKGEKEITAHSWRWKLFKHITSQIYRHLEEHRRNQLVTNLRSLGLNPPVLGGVGGPDSNCSNLGENGLAGNAPFSGALLKAAGKFILFADFKVCGLLGG